MKTTSKIQVCASLLRSYLTLSMHEVPGVFLPTQSKQKRREMAPEIKKQIMSGPVITFANADRDWAATGFCLVAQVQTAISMARGGLIYCSKMIRKAVTFVIYMTIDSYRCHTVEATMLPDMN